MLVDEFTDGRKIKMANEKKTFQVFITNGEFERGGGYIDYLSKALEFTLYRYELQDAKNLEEVEPIKGDIDIEVAISSGIIEDLISPAPIIEKVIEALKENDILDDSDYFIRHIGVTAWDNKKNIMSIACKYDEEKQR